MVGKNKIIKQKPEGNKIPIRKQKSNAKPRKKIKQIVSEKKEIVKEKNIKELPTVKKGQKKSFDITKYLSFGKEKDYFVENLSLLIASGMPVLDAVRAIEKELKSLKMKRVVAQLVTDLEEGGTLWHSLDKTEMFNEYSVSLIKIGEESGRFVENIKIIAEQEEKSKQFRSKIRSASMYPLIVLSLALVVGFGIAYFILPRLATVFSQLKLDLPLATKILIGAGVFLEAHGAIVIPICAVGIIALFYFTFYYPKTRIVGQVLLFNTPGVHRLIQEIEISRFGYLFGTLLGAGVPVTKACTSLAAATHFAHYKKFYIYLEQRFDDGYLFEESFKDFPKSTKLIPGPIQQIIIAGERSGRLADTLVKISDAFEDKTEQTTKNLSTILEPILLICIWLGVLGIAIAVILPIYSLVGGLRGGETSRTRAQAEEKALREESVEVIPALSTEIIDETPVPLLRIVTDGAYVSVREDASIEGGIVAQAYAEETYEYVDEDGGWYEIVLSELETGWVSEEYVEVIQNGEEPVI